MRAGQEAFILSGALLLEMILESTVQRGVPTIASRKVFFDRRRQADGEFCCTKNVEFFTSSAFERGYVAVEPFSSLICIKAKLRLFYVSWVVLGGFHEKIRDSGTRLAL
jgi:hypothetical protein